LSLLEETIDQWVASERLVLQASGADVEGGE
jgi:hypothetical protein